MKHFLLLSIIITLYSCSQKPQENQLNTDEHTATNELMQIITLDTVQAATVYDELNLNGKVTFNQKNVARVFPIFGGQVTEVLAEIGDYVHKGAPLATIRSSEVSEYEKEKKEIEQKLRIANHNLQYTQDLFQSGMASERDLLQARQDVSNAQAEEKKIKEVFSIFKITGESVYTLTAPVSGFVVEKNINPEMQLRSDQSEEIFMLSGLDNIWIMADVYEGDISKIKENTHVHIQTLAYPDKIFEGKIDKLHHVMDENSKTMKVRIELNNPGLLLKPGMFATVKVENNSSTQTLSAIPSQSLLFENGRNYVVTLSNEHKLDIREVQVYKQTEALCYISSGISPQETIVVKNSLLVYNSLKK